MAAVPSRTSSEPATVAPADVPFALRPAEAGDFEAYMDAFEAVAAEGRWMGAEAPLDRDARRAAFERALAGDGSVLFLAEAGTEIVGGVYASVSGGIVDLGMFVARGRRGGGIGSALLEAVIGWARQQGAHKISLAAWPTNHPAIGLYARHGFLIEGTRRRHWRRRSGALWDAVLMGLVLDEETPGGPGERKPPPPPVVLPDGGLTARSTGRGAASDDAVVLREWRRADIPALVTLIEDPEIRRWIDIIPKPYTTADAEEYIAGARVDHAAGTAVRLAVVSGGDLAGSVDLRLGGDGGAAIGYWVAAAARGRGVGSTAARLLSDFGFRTLGLRRIELNAAVANTASRRVAEKAGFELEGVRRSWRTVGGVPADFALYSRVADGLDAVDGAQPARA